MAGVGPAMASCGGARGVSDDSDLGTRRAQVSARERLRETRGCSGREESKRGSPEKKWRRRRRWRPESEKTACARLLGGGFSELMEGLDSC